MGAGMKKEIMPRVVTIGNFDGVHRGHQEVVRHAAQVAQREDGICRALTFYPYPQQVLHPEIYQGELMDVEDKVRYLTLAGADEVQVLETDAELLSWSPERFLEYVTAQEGLQAIVVGEDFRFGKAASGDVETLRQFAVAKGYTLHTVPLLKDESGERISSTRIRRDLAQGRMKNVTAALRRYWSLAGAVQHGDARGRMIGFPTLNLDIPTQRVVPTDGVYAAVVAYAGQLYPAVANIGTNPTFAGTQKRVEAHVLDFSEMIYGEEVRIFFVEGIRGEKRFANVQELCSRIEEDIKIAKNILADEVYIDKCL